MANLPTCIPYKSSLKHNFAILALINSLCIFMLVEFRNNLCLLNPLHQAGYNSLKISTSWRAINISLSNFLLSKLEIWNL